MSSTLNRALALAAPVLALAILSSCSDSGQPAVGTPAYAWKAAGESYKGGDLMKTLDNLDQILATDNDYTARALPWALVLSSGVASGYADLADAYETGGKANRTNPAAFHRSVAQCKGFMKQLSLSFAERAGKLDRVKGDSLPLAFVYPAGTAAPVPAISKITGGVILPAPEAESTQKRALERGVLLAACRFAGAADDTAKTEAILKAPDAKVSRGDFQLAIAQTLYTQSAYYGPQKLDDAEKSRLFCERAQDMLKGVPESKQSKDLTAKIQKALKAKKT